MNQAARTLIKYAPRKYELIFGYIEPKSLILRNVPNLYELPFGSEARKVLLTHTYSEHIMMNGFIANIPLSRVWNIVKSIQYFYDELGGELIDSLIVVYLLCRYYDCIPMESFPAEFDCQLDLHQNWERGFMDEQQNLLSRKIDIGDNLSEDVRNEMRRIFGSYENPLQ